MQIKDLIRRTIIGLLSLFMIAGVQAGAPLWTFEPMTATMVTVPANGTALVQYRVINQSSKPHTLTMKPIQGITQTISGTSVCGSSFTLPAKGSSCILSLMVNGSQLAGTISDGPIVCQQGSSNLCYRPSEKYVLHINQGPPLVDATIAITGSPLILTASGTTGTLTIRNTSLQVIATNITSDFTGTALQGNVTEIDNTCDTVAPGGSCTLTYMPGNVVVQQTNFSIQGSNTNTIVASIAINPAAPTLTLINPNAGTTLGGTSVTLTGTNLTDTSSVTFDGIAATNIVVVNSTTVTVDTPAHAAGAVDVVIATPGGSATLVNGYTYELLPTLTAVNPSSGPASGATGVVLTGTNLTGTTSVTFDGVAATSVNVVNSTTVTAVTPTHAVGAVDVVITTPEGNALLPNGYTYVSTAVGLPSGGGTIACLNGGFENLIAATNDNSGALQWGGSGILIGAGAQDNVDGATNTFEIINVLSNPPNNLPEVSYAAGLCNLYEVDSQGNSPCLANNTCYNDWFLPALDQLVCLYTNRVAIGNFTLGVYWSSTESTDVGAWVVVFNGGAQLVSGKIIPRVVRCVRAFTP